MLCVWSVLCVVCIECVVRVVLARRRRRRRRRDTPTQPPQPTTANKATSHSRLQHEHELKSIVFGHVTFCVAQVRVCRVSLALQSRRTCSAQQTNARLLTTTKPKQNANKLLNSKYNQQQNNNTKTKHNKKGAGQQPARVDPDAELGGRDHAAGGDGRRPVAQLAGLLEHG